MVHVNNTTLAVFHNGYVDTNIFALFRNFYKCEFLAVFSKNNFFNLRKYKTGLQFLFAAIIMLVKIKQDMIVTNIYAYTSCKFTIV